MNFERLELVLSEALDKSSGEEREAFLAESCAGDPGFRAEIERLIRANELAVSFLEEPVTPILAEPIGEKAGQTIGRYQLLEEIGQGGFGVVFLAEQSQPFRRKVALKIIKAGMDTREFIARFEAERQALALMDHPNIARVFDAGATETGRPYFVMEWVHGTPVTEYCDEHGLSTAERLLLFMEVCQAVQHAHQKGIIHRDIKPGNILVTLVDGHPIPKVIDFGVAKALGQKLTEKTLLTSSFQMVGTPAYMSPEQAGLSGVDIDTRSDIYSLGVLLYELLTGVTPFDQRTLHQLNYEEIRQHIREVEPVKPSERLLARQDGQSKFEVTHRAAPVAVARAIEGDLDWIVMKCLEKDRNRRYETANALEEDIHKHLRHEPVSAAAPGHFYRTRKFVRRHRSGLAVGCALFLLLLGATVVSISQAAIARSAVKKQKTALEQAQSEAEKSQQVVRLFQDVIAGVSPSVAAGRDTSVLREILDKTAERVGKDLTNQPQAEALLRLTLADTYRALGQFPESRNMAEAALRICQDRLGRNPPETAAALGALALAAAELGDFPTAEQRGREALAASDKLPNPESEDAARIMANLGWILCKVGKFQEAETNLNRALTLLGKLPGDHELAKSAILLQFSVSLGLQNRWEQAEILINEAIVIRENNRGTNTPSYADALAALARAVAAQNDLQRAKDVLRRVIDIRKQLLPQGHPDSIVAMTSLSSVLLSLDEAPEAEQWAQKALDLALKTLGTNHPITGAARNELGMALWRRGDLPRAEELLRRAFRPTPGGHFEVGVAMGNLIDLLMEQKKYEDVEKVFLELNIFKRPAFDKFEPQDAIPLHHRASYFARRGLWRQAADHLRKATELEPYNYVHQIELAALLVISEDHESYRKLRRSFVEFLKEQHGGSVVGQVVEICLLLPESGANAKDMADYALSIQAHSSSPAGWPDFVRSLIDLRIGEFKSAAQFAQKASGAPAGTPDLYIQAQALSVLTICEHRLGTISKALTYSRAKKAHESLPSADNGDLGKRWVDWVISKVLLSEAASFSETAATTR